MDGPIVAYEEFVSTEPADRRLVIVRDLRSGRVLHSLPTGTPIPPEPPEPSVGKGPTVAIVVKRDGSVAWIVESKFPSAEYETNFTPAEYEIHAVDRSGSRLLAKGANIDRSSLALAGSTLYWTQSGKPASAVLN